MKNLHILREQIDEIDDQIVELIYRRGKITDEIGSLKANSSAPAVDEKREQQILSRLTEKAKALSLNPELISLIFKSIFSEAVLKHRIIHKRGMNNG